MAPLVLKIRIRYNNVKKEVYNKYKKHAFWKVIENAIDALIINNDLEEKTAHHNVVGYLTKCLCDHIDRANVKNTEKLETLSIMKNLKAKSFNP